MNEPLISFIIPIYNVEKYLRQCVDSIINQSFKEIEVILVNDGSQDNCPKICDDYAKKDNRIKVIHKSNSGVSETRNFGINKAVGKYTLFVDADDFIGENSLRKIVNIIDDNAQVDVIFLEAVKYFEKNNLCIPMNDGYKEEMIEGKTKKEVVEHLASLAKYPGSACSKLIKRSIIIENELYFKKEMILAEDLDWTIRLLIFANSFGYCKSDYYYYRKNRQGSATDTFNCEKFQCLFEFIKLWSNINENDKGYAYKNQIFSFMAYEYSILLAFYPQLNKINKNKYKNEIKNYSWLMDYREERKNKMVRISYKLLGLKITSKALNFYLNHRRV